MPDLSYQLVTGRWSYVVADGIRKTTDPDAHPDEVLPGGVVVFTPEIGNNPDLPTGSPSRSVALGVITGLVADGVLQDLDGRDGIELVTRVGTRPVYWTAKPALTFGNRAIAARTYTFGPTPAGGTIHLNDTVDPGDYPDLTDELMLELLAKYSKPAGGIPDTDLTPTTRDKLAALGPELRYALTHSMAGATNGMALPAFADSGQELSWVGSQINTGTLTGRGAFWGVPGGSAAYCSAKMKKKPTWGRMRFAFYPGSGGTGGTACIAVTSRTISMAGGPDLDMAVHFWSTRTAWAMTVWKGTDTPQQSIVATGSYAQPLPASAESLIELSMVFKIVGESIHFRLPDGLRRRVTDPRFASLGGPNLFAESFMPGGTDDVAIIFGFDGGCETVPVDIFEGSPSALPVGGGGASGVTSVAGKTGVVSLTKADVGLALVDNTADTSKPVSTPQQNALALKADLVGGIIPQAQMPAIAVTEFLGAVGSQAAMLLLSGQRGDWCTRTDLGTDWQLITEPSSTLASWRERTYPQSPVSSVAGRTGAVTISTGDVTDSTTVGRAVVKATDQAAARSAIGAGTSSLTLGTTGSTAAAGNDARIVAGGTAAQPADIAAAQLVAINAQTAAYQLVLADQNKAVEVTAASGVAVTVPANATAAFPIGAVIEIVQTGAGQVTITPASGVTINTSASLITRAQWASVVLRKRAADTWLLAGDVQ